VHVGRQRSRHNDSEEEEVIQDSRLMNSQQKPIKIGAMNSYFAQNNIIASKASGANEGPASGAVPRQHVLTF
jgi:hypothetical protein